MGVGLSAAHQGVAVAGHDAVHDAALSDSAAQDSLDTVLGHEIQGSLCAALDGLPALHRQGLWAGHQRQLLEGVAAVGNLWRQGVVLPLVREGLIVERLEDDVHRFFEFFPVGVLVRDVGTKGLDLAGVVAATYAENHPTVSQDVGGGVVLGQAQGVPHGSDVEPTAELDVFGQVGQMDVQHDQVGNTLVPLRLKVVLRHPHRVEPVGVQGLGDGLSLAIGSDQVVIVKFPVVDWHPAVADIGHVHVTGV